MRVKNIEKIDLPTVVITMKSFNRKSGSSGERIRWLVGAFEHYELINSSKRFELTEIEDHRRHLQDGEKTAQKV